jgi:hypothetical protein
VAILGVMHFAKSTHRPAIYRAVGSIAFAAAARIVLAVAGDPERDGRRILAPVKSNLAAPSAALAYVLADDRLVWEPDPVSNVDIDALLAGRALDQQERRQAEAWLRDCWQEDRCDQGRFTPPRERRASRGEPSSGLNIASAWRPTESATARPASGTGGCQRPPPRHRPPENRRWRSLSDPVDSSIFPPITPKAATRESLAVSDEVVAVSDRLEVDPWPRP